MGAAHPAECVWDLRALLGEGPIWSAADRAVWFVDIKGKHIHRFDPASRSGRTWIAPSEPGFIAPIAGGGFVAGLKTGLQRFDPADGSFTLLAKIEDPALDNRLNDACVDREGRLWFGSMHDPEKNETGALYRYTGGPRAVAMDPGYCITNGPAVCPRGKTLYHIDTVRRIVYAFDLAADGTLSGKREFVRIDKPGAYPDGPVVDSEGCVWIGLYGGWALVRYSPDGELIGEIRLPVANVTKAAFGGKHLRTLYITTARKELSEPDLRQQPLAGNLFSAEVDVPGLPQNEVRL